MILSVSSVQLWDKHIHGVLGEELAKDRAPRMVMDGASSGWQSVTSDFPQGVNSRASSIHLSTIWMQECTMSKLMIAVGPFQ